MSRDDAWYRGPFWPIHKPFERQIGSPTVEGFPFLRLRPKGPQSPYRPVSRRDETERDWGGLNDSDDNLNEAD